MPITVRRLDTDGKIVRLESDTSAKSTGGCCGGAAPAGADACCALDAEVKATGGSGCGCGASAAAPKAGGCC